LILSSTAPRGLPAWGPRSAPGSDTTYLRGDCNRPAWQAHVAGTLSCLPKLDKKVRNAIIRPKSEEIDQMKISAHEEYGLRCLVQLARAEADEESLTLNQIADREGLSVANAGKLMWILVKAGLVQSQRGANGGYTLARPAADIRLNEVIRILDEDTVDHFCKTHTGVLDACIHTSECGIRPVIVGLHEIVQNALSEITLAELIGSEENVDARLHQIQKMQSPLRTARSAN